MPRGKNNELPPIFGRRHGLESKKCCAIESALLKWNKMKFYFILFIIADA